MKGYSFCLKPETTGLIPLIWKISTLYRNIHSFYSRRHIESLIIILTTDPDFALLFPKEG